MMRLDAHPKYGERDMLRRVFRRNFGVGVAAVLPAWCALRVGAIVGESFGSLDNTAYRLSRRLLRADGYDGTTVSRFVLRTREDMQLADLLAASAGWPDWVQRETYAPRTCYKLELEDVLHALRGLEFRTRTKQ